MWQLRARAASLTRGYWDLGATGRAGRGRTARAPTPHGQEISGVWRSSPGAGPGDLTWEPPYAAAPALTSAPAQPALRSAASAGRPAGSSGRGGAGRRPGAGRGRGLGGAELALLGVGKPEYWSPGWNLAIIGLSSRGCTIGGVRGLFSE